MDRLLQKHFSDDSAIAYAYDQSGFLKTVTNARGTVKTYKYDPNRNIESISYSDNTPAVSFSYDDYNRVTRRTDGAGTHQYAYNNNSFLTGINGPWENDQLLFTYNALGLASGFLIENSTPTVYTYDHLSRLTQVRKGDDTYTYAYSGAHPLVQKLTRPNGSATEYLYDSALGRLTDVVNQKADQTLISKNSYTYNDRDLIDTETVTNGLALSSLEQGLVTYDYNPVNQLLSASDSQSRKVFEFDADGNMTEGYTPQGFVLTMAYDAENRLISSEFTDNNQTHHRTEYTYAGDHFLAQVKKFENGSLVSTARMVRAGLLTVQERDENNQIIRAYQWGLDMGGGIGGLLAMQHGSGSYDYLYDGKGNVKALIDRNQDIVASYAYSPFGQLLSKAGTVSQPYQFSTKRFDAQTGLVYYGYRYYVPAIGRWATRDPIGFAGGDINLYGFVSNDPVNAIDPDGRLAWLLPAIFGGEAVTGAITSVGLGVGLAAIWDWLWNEKTEDGTEGDGSSCPPYPGDDPTVAPEGFDWKGKPGSKPGDKEGNYHNPETGESLRPDVDHEPPVGSHWDYKDPNGNWHRIYPDGSVVPK